MDVEIVRIKEVAADEKKAYVELEVKYRKIKAPHPETFAGIVKLERNGDQWIITTYLSSQGTPLLEDSVMPPDRKPEKPSSSTVQPRSVPEPVHPGTAVQPEPVHPESSAEGASTPVPSTFGSERILKSCWTKE